MSSSHSTHSTAAQSPATIPSCVSPLWWRCGGGGGGVGAEVAPATTWGELLLGAALRLYASLGANDEDIRQRCECVGLCLREVDLSYEPK